MNITLATDFLKSLPDDISIPYLSFKLIDKFSQTHQLIFPNEECRDHRIRINYKKRRYNIGIFEYFKEPNERVIGSISESTIDFGPIEKMIVIPTKDELREFPEKNRQDFTFMVSKRSIIDDFCKEVDYWLNMNDSISLMLIIGIDPLKFSKFRQENNLEDFKEFLYSKIDFSLS